MKEIPFMADHLGVCFDSFFGPLLVQSLCDPVSEVRLAAGNVARCLAKCLGQEWANASLILEVLAQLSGHWSRRMSVLFVPSLRTWPDKSVGNDVRICVEYSDLHLWRNPLRREANNSFLGQPESQLSECNFPLRIFESGILYQRTVGQRAVQAQR